METTADQLMGNIAREILNPIVTLLFAAALVYFIYGVVMFIANADNEQARGKGKKHLLYSIMGFVVMVGVYGILRILMGTFGVTDIPGIPGM